MRFRIAYDAGATLVDDDAREFAHGGVLVRVSPPAGLALFAKVELELSLGGERVTLPAEVVQMFPGVGVALSFAPGTPALRALVERARTDASPAGLALHAIDDGTAAPAAPAALAPPAKPRRPAPSAESTSAKIQQALHGDRDARAAILRDSNRSLHIYVLKNPNLQLDEIAALARATTVSTEVLKTIAERREWGHRPEIAIALVRNPTVPVPIALKALDHVSPADLKQLAKDTRTRDPIQRAARKKLVGPI